MWKLLKESTRIILKTVLVFCVLIVLFALSCQVCSYCFYSSMDDVIEEMESDMNQEEENEP